jgi:hypothetical protein
MRDFNASTRERSSIECGKTIDLLLLDTHDMCVVKAPDSCRYVALSYVWGQTRFLLLTTENQPILECPGSLEDREIPRTIREALSLTKMLGERYPWVDAL